MITAKDISEVIISALVEEIKLQGHNDTGKLINSFESTETETGKKTTIEILFFNYGMFLNYGRKPGSYVPFAVLFDWVKRRLNLSGLQARSATFAINQKIFKEGSPTKGALKYSSTGKRTQFIDDALKRKDKEITEAIGQYFETVLSKKIDIITKVGKYQF